MQELREESERKNAQVENLKKEKRNLLVKICRLNKKGKVNLTTLFLKMLNKS